MCIAESQLLSCIHTLLSQLYHHSWSEPFSRGSRSCLPFFFLRWQNTAEHRQITERISKEKRLQTSPSASQRRRRRRAPSVARRCSSSSNLGTGAPPSMREVADRRSRKIYAWGRRRRHAGPPLHQPKIRVINNSNPDTNKCKLYNQGPYKCEKISSNGWQIVIGKVQCLIWNDSVLSDIVEVAKIVYYLKW